MHRRSFSLVYLEGQPKAHTRSPLVILGGKKLQFEAYKSVANFNDTTRKKQPNARTRSPLVILSGNKLQFEAYESSANFSDTICQKIQGGLVNTLVNPVSYKDFREVKLRMGPQSSAQHKAIHDNLTSISTHISCMALGEEELLCL